MQQIVEMGFSDRDAVKAALLAAGGRVEGAVTRLMGEKSSAEHVGIVYGKGGDVRSASVDGGGSKRQRVAGTGLGRGRSGVGVSLS